MRHGKVARSWQALRLLAATEALAMPRPVSGQRSAVSAWMIDPRSLLLTRLARVTTLLHIHDLRRHTPMQMAAYPSGARTAQRCAARQQPLLGTAPLRGGLQRTAASPATG
ncbi:hypothetical protein CKY51_06630 [Xanthomonas maliensis]|nr:hypothetical protein CKY51_06630 [Xanthomonas maliensis]